MSPMYEDLQLSNFEKEGMKFKVTITRRAAMVKDWVCLVKQKFLDNTDIKCVGLDCKFTNASKKAERRYLPAEKQQRATVL